MAVLLLCVDQAALGSPRDQLSLLELSVSDHIQPCVIFSLKPLLSAPSRVDLLSWGHWLSSEMFFLLSSDIIEKDHARPGNCVSG